jgi:ferredoxin-type protein NapF
MGSGTAPDLVRRRLLFGTYARPRREPPPPPTPIAVIAGSCLAVRGIPCMACRDACSLGAIWVALARGGARQSVVAETCTGCAPVCPVGAIAMAAEPRGEATGA